MAEIHWEVRLKSNWGEQHLLMTHYDQLRQIVLAKDANFCRTVTHLPPTTNQTGWAHLKIPRRVYSPTRDKKPCTRPPLERLCLSKSRGGAAW